MAVSNMVSDVIIVGGGLRGCLIAIEIANRRPDVDFLLVERAARFGGGAIDPFFIDLLPARHLGALEGAVVSEWSSYYFALGEKNRRVARQSAMLAPEQLHLEVTKRVPPRQLLVNCGVTFATDRTVLTAQGLIHAHNVIDVTARDGSNAERLWCDAADFVTKVRQDFSIPVLGDDQLHVTMDQGLAQYIPISPVAVTVRAVTIAETLRGAGPTLSDMQASNKRRTSYPIDVIDTAVPQLPAHPLLPSDVYDAVALARAVAALPLREHVDLRRCWKDIGAKWRSQYANRIDLLHKLPRSLDGSPWVRLADDPAYKNFVQTTDATDLP